MNEFVSWETLGTFAGCAMLVGILTQFTKGLFSKLPTQWLSYIYAVVVMALAAIFTTGFSWPTLALIPFNAVIVAMSANAFEEDMKKSLESGMNAHLAKPFQVEALVETLHTIMKEKGAS